MTTIYFIRHAEPDYTNHNDRERPLTQKGKEDSKLVTQYLCDKNIDIVLSSPYVRAVDTVKDFAESFGYPILTVEDFRERKVDSIWIEDFYKFSKMQWDDFEYKLSDGESLREVQDRNINALMEVLKEYTGKNIVIGSHGTALSTIINYFEPTYSFDDFQRIRNIMPWIVKMSFQGDTLIHIEKIDVFNLKNNENSES
ncbi:histidine phosphatase family protein [Clostridium sp. Marseille-P299]|uniref:histidine phosphatase family protein n=1 Tax=Clostridium sp. Marseille-P299 TaxID=1805477 RepID=UPI00082C9518|nr:histidine phosphatase family protein [Clostridium sp. Marseille-P299]